MNSIHCKQVIYSSLIRPLLASIWSNLVFLTLFLLLMMQVATPSQAGDTVPKKNFTSVEERRLFNAIQTERASIREEKNGLELKKKELKSIEEGVDKKLAKLDEKLSELKALQRKIEKLMAAKSAEELQRSKDLAKIYEKMSPARAAQAMTGLKPGLAAELLSNMKAKSAAKVLDQISKNKATELSTAFSTIQLE